MLIRLQSVATNYNYYTSKLCEYYRILKDKYHVDLYNSKTLKKIEEYQINVNTVDENSFIEFDINNDLNALKELAEVLGADLILRPEKCTTAYLYILVHDDFWE